MSRPLRGLLLGSIALAFLYLLAHAREPLRLNLGDPASDARILSYLGVRDIGSLRFVALAWSALAMWLLFCYVRRLYTDRIGLIATALFSTSLLWMTYADSIHHVPVMTAMLFLALWGLIRAIETRQRRHYAAAVLGSFGAFLVSFECYLFLPVAVLVTVYLKAGTPFTRGTRLVLAICAAGCAIALGVKCGVLGWELLPVDIELQHDRKFQASVIPTLVRRLTLVFTPLIWLTAGFHVLKAIRAPSFTAAVKDTAAWMVLAAVAFVAAVPQLAASQMVTSQVFLPFYAIGSALVVDRLLEGSYRRIAVAWLIAAPLWSFAILVTHPREVLDPDDVAKTTAYLAANDPNNFVLSSLMAAGHIETSFQRHARAALDEEDPARGTLRIFGTTGSASLHAVIAKGPDSRFIDGALWSLAMPRRLWSITGWPQLHRKKARSVIAAYDRRVKANLDAVRATKVLDLSNYALYRVDRAAVLALLGEAVPSSGHIDFGTLAASAHLLLGWTPLHVLPAEQMAVRTTDGSRTAQLMIRVERACDLRLTFAFATNAYVRFSINGFAVTPLPGRTATFTVPAAKLTAGINVIELEPLLPPGTGVHLASLALACT